MKSKKCTVLSLSVILVFIREFAAIVILIKELFVSIALIIILIEILLTFVSLFSFSASTVAYTLLFSSVKR